MENKNIPPRVAVATGESREETVRKALALVRGDILAKVKGRVLIKPNFLSSVHRPASTQAGAVRPVLELLDDADTKSVVIAEGGARSTPQALDNFGYRELAEEFGVELIDLNHVSFSRSFEIVTGKQDTQIAQYADIAAEADTIISVPVAKTHDAAVVTLSVKNMMGCLRRVHRPRMHGLKIGTVPSCMGELLWNAVEGHPLVIKSFSGIVFTIANRLRTRNANKNAKKRTGLLRQVRAISENIICLSRVLMPDVAVIDAFEAMEGDGPGRSGKSVKMKIAVAGTDPVACDAVMAFMMGFEPMSIGYLCLANEAGLGVAELEKIKCVGEDPAQHVRRFKPHSNYPVQLRWREAWE